MHATLHEALEHSRQTRNPYLDLGNLGLNGTEPELDALKDFTWVETLNFSNTNYREMDHSPRMWHNYKPDAKYNKLIKIPNKLPNKLKKLRCNGEYEYGYAQKISDISTVSELKYLEYLELFRNEISDILPL